MAVPLAQVSDVAAVWRPVTDADEVARVTYLLGLASAKLRSVLPNIDVRIGLVPPDPLALDPVLVAGVVAGMVKRVVVNPEGLQSSTRTVGPYSESKTHGAQGYGSGELVVTAEDIAQLLPVQPRSGVRTIQTGLSDRMVNPERRWRRPWILPLP
jgi:hypothetical protein